MRRLLILGLFIFSGCWENEKDCASYCQGQWQVREWRQETKLCLCRHGAEACAAECEHRGLAFGAYQSGGFFAGPLCQCLR
jgi:hypothetical protein